MPPPNPIAEALELAGETLRALELEQVSLPSIAMRAGRIARLLGDSDFEKIFGWEVSGYPLSEDGASAELWRLAGIADRYFNQVDPKGGKTKQFMYVESIEAIEAALKVARERLAVAGDRAGDQRVMGNVWERNGLTVSIQMNLNRLARRRGLLHQFLSSRYHQLKYSEIASDAFTRLRAEVDAALANRVPEAVKKFDSAYANLESANAEDWANAVHSCRRILEELADSLFPPQDEDRIRGDKRIKLGPKHYKNRLICYVEDHSGSATFTAVIGSNLSFVADRIGAIFDASNKGTHAGVTKQHADRYVIYTYLLIGDILAVRSEGAASNSTLQPTPTRAV